MKRFRGGLFRRYVLSYLSVTVLVCLVLGMALTGASIARLRQKEIESCQNRMYLAADYIERQFEIMENIRVEIKANRVYQPFYRKQNVVCELELIRDFSRFANYSNFVEEYYLWCIAEERIYGTHAAYMLDVFLPGLLGSASQEDLKHCLTPAGSIHLQVLSQRPDSLLISLPFRFGSGKQPEGQSALLFLVRLNKIRETINQITDVQKEEPITLQYGDCYILEGVPTENVLNVVGPKGLIKLTMSLGSFQQLNHLNTFWKTTLAITVMVLIVGAGVSIVIAWHNYRAIQRIYAKHADKDQTSSDELQSIEQMLDNAREINSLSQKQIEDQLRQISQQQAWLRQQIVMMLISGNVNQVVLRQICETDFAMLHGLHAILFIHIQQGQPANGFLRDIESYSDEEISLYAAELRAAQAYAVLINFEEDEQVQGLLDLLSDTFAAHNVVANVQLSRSCADLKGIVTVAMEALNTRPLLLPAEKMKIEPQEDNIQHMLELAESGYVSHALSLLDTIVASIESRYPSYLMKVYMLNILHSRVFYRALQCGVEVHALFEKSNPQDPALILQHLRILVRNLANTTVSVSESCVEVQDNKAISYIQEHCLEPDISLSSAAQALEISTKQVTRLVRMGIDMTFKEYLTKLRMEAAEKILLDDVLSIAETAEKVGYYSVSHFIKCFKMYNGVTPGEWKKRMGK
ncbi:MAG: helix-turn-helix domain-containing protein [Christensenellales bacterium]|jgi:AraC-like DNA-binding protein